MFDDAPPAISSFISAGAAGSAGAAQTAISTAWAAWLPGPLGAWPGVVQVPTSVGDLTNALVEDNLHEVPYRVCRFMVQAFTTSVAGRRKVRGEMENASSRLKATASELMAAAATIHTAHHSGLKFVGTRGDINAFFGEEIWQYRWPGSYGPDYLFTDAVGNATFIEVKGDAFVLRMRPRAKQLASFSLHKTQSVNARLLMPKHFPMPAVRYILSRVRKHTDGTIYVQWFNHREESDANPRGCSAIALAVALSNYKQVLRSVFGEGDIRLYSKPNMPGYPTYAHTEDWRQRETESGLRTFVPSAIVTVFARIEDHFRDWRERHLGREENGDWLREANKLRDALLQTLEAHSASDIGRLEFERNLILRALPMGIAVGDLQPFE